MKAKIRRRPLKDHQVRAVEFCRSHRHPALFMEMRLGKNLVVIRHLRERVKDGEILVVAPNTVLIAWEQELTKEGERFVTLRGTEAKRNKIHDEHIQTGHRYWHLITYQSLTRTPAVFDHEYDAVVLDESTKIKNPLARVTKLVLRKFRGAAHRMVLSGSPSPESQMEYWPQIAFCTGRFMGHSNFWSWRAAWFMPDSRGWNWIPTTGFKAALEASLKEHAFCMTRKAAGVVEEKIRQRRFFEFNPAQMRAYTLARDSFRRELTDGSTEDTMQAMVRLGWMHRICGGFSADGKRVLNPAKMIDVAELLKGELAGEPVVIWFHFLAEIDAVGIMLNEMKFRVGVIRGSVKPEDRRTIIEDFQAGRLDVLLVQEAVGQYGIDLSRSSTSIHYSRGYSNELCLQSEDRIVSLAKREALLYLDLVTPGFVDEEIADLLVSKKLSSKILLSRLSGSVVQSTRTSPREVSDGR